MLYCLSLSLLVLINAQLQVLRLQVFAVCSISLPNNVMKHKKVLTKNERKKCLNEMSSGQLTLSFLFFIPVTYLTNLFTVI
jgi:hypothetical protein